MIRSVDDTVRSAVVGKLVSGGGMGIRTPDPDLAKVVLYQLSYAPGRAEPGCSVRRIGRPIEPVSVAAIGGLVWIRTRDLTLIRRVL